MERAIATSPSADLVADLAIMHEGLAAGAEGPHDEDAARYYSQALRLDSGNIKALIGRVRRADRNATAVLQQQKAVQTNQAKTHSEVRRGMCAMIAEASNRAEAIVQNDCNYFEAAECETTRGFARNYVLQRVVPQLVYKWGCNPEQAYP